MPVGNHLIAWVERHQEQEFTAAFVAALASRRRPATRRCTSVHEARLWVEREAEALGGIPVEWADRPPHGR